MESKQLKVTDYGPILEYLLILFIFSVIYTPFFFKAHVHIIKRLKVLNNEAKKEDVNIKKACKHPL